MRFLRSLPLLFLVLCCSGCISVSLKPYYTPENQIPVPDELVGLWRFDQFQGKKIANIKAVQIQIAKDGTTRVSQFPAEGGEQGATLLSTFRTQFFRINGELYADCLLSSLREGSLSAAEALTVVPGHLLVKLSLSGETLRAVYPALLPKLAEEGKLPPELTWVQKETDPGKAAAVWVFTAPGSVWEETLKTMSPQIFPDLPAATYEFRRVLIQ